MSKSKIVVYCTDMPKDVMADLNQRYDVSFFPSPQKNRAEFLTAVQEAEGLLGTTMKLGKEELASSKKLKVIANAAVGVDNYDLDYLKSHDIVLTNTPLAVTQATADTAFLLLMMTAKNAYQLSYMVQSGKWKEQVHPDGYGVDVFGKTLGIIGFGRIGQALAKRAHLGFDMPILYCNPQSVPEAEKALKAVKLSQADLLAKADFICLCVPGTPENKHLISRKELNHMKSDAILINMARGNVVDNDALYQSLKDKQIRGAGLDVFEQEPLPKESPLLELKNLVTTPHIGTATVEARHLMCKTAADDLIAVLSHKAPKFPVE